MPTTSGVLSDLHHEVRGDGPPVVFITGASGDAGHFARAAERLAGEFTAVTYDRRGCSRSAPLPADEVMSIADQADDAARLVEELGVAPAVVFGTSGGGDILLDLLARRPAVLRGAIVHEPRRPHPGAGGRRSAPADRRAREHRSPRGDGGLPAPEHERRDVRGARPAAARADPGRRRTLLRAAAPGVRAFVPDVEGIRASGVPLRLLVSADGVPPLIGATERLARELALEVGSISGHHAPYLQQPEAFAEELRPILRELV